MVEAEGHLKLLSPSILNIYKVFEHLIFCPLAYDRSLTQFYQILGYCVTCGVKMMSLH
jgi:hypothetical protein